MFYPSPRSPRERHAPVAQGIEQRPPEPCAQVRILPGAPCMRCPKTPSPAETLRPGSSRMCRRVRPGAALGRGPWTIRGQDLGAFPLVSRSAGRSSGEPGSVAAEHQRAGHLPGRPADRGSRHAMLSGRSPRVSASRVLGCPVLARQGGTMSTAAERLRADSETMRIIETFAGRSEIGLFSMRELRRIGKHRSLRGQALTHITEILRAQKLEYLPIRLPRNQDHRIVVWRRGTPGTDLLERVQWLSSEAGMHGAAARLSDGEIVQLYRSALAEQDRHA